MKPVCVYILYLLHRAEGIVCLCGASSAFMNGQGRQDPPVFLASSSEHARAPHGHHRQPSGMLTLRGVLWDCSSSPSGKALHPVPQRRPGAPALLQKCLGGICTTPTPLAGTPGHRDSGRVPQGQWPCPTQALLPGRPVPMEEKVSAAISLRPAP